MKTRFINTAKTDRTIKKAFARRYFLEAKQVSVESVAQVTKHEVIALLNVTDAGGLKSKPFVVALIDNKNDLTIALDQFAKMSDAVRTYHDLVN